MSKAVITFEQEDGDNVGLLLEYFDEEGRKVAFNSEQIAHQMATCVHRVALLVPDRLADLIRELQEEQRNGPKASAEAE